MQLECIFLLIPSVNMKWLFERVPFAINAYSLSLLVIYFWLNDIFIRIVCITALYYLIELVVGSSISKALNEVVRFIKISILHYSIAVILSFIYIWISYFSSSEFNLSFAIIMILNSIIYDVTLYEKYKP